MVSSVENNSINTSLKKPLNVGVLTPPNALHKHVLYSDKEADMQFKQLAKDIYDREHSQKFENKRKTPLSVILTVFAAAIGSGYMVFKKALKW